MDTIFISILILFIAAAVQDYLKREVDNWITAIAWLMTAILFQNYPLMLFFFIVFFTGAWLVAELCEKLKNPLMGFGDVLWLPVFASLITFHPNGNVDYALAIVLTAIAILISQLYLRYQLDLKKLPREKVNGSPFVSILLVILTIAYALNLSFS